MLQPGMKVRHKTDGTITSRIATLVHPSVGLNGRKGWRVLVGAYNGFWFESNIIPLVDTNEEGLVLLNKTDTF
jgi:hypothetical protein